jgi:hypothetical protein
MKIFRDIIKQNVHCFRKIIAIKVNKLYIFSDINTYLFKRNIYKIVIKTNFNLKYINSFLIFKNINF